MFCAIGSERIILPFGFERCVSAAEALQYLQYAIGGIVLMAILALIIWTLWSLHAAWLNRRLRNLESVNTALMHELHAPNKEFHQYRL